MYENIIDIIAPQRYIPFTNNKMKIVEGLKRNNPKVFKNLKRNIIFKKISPLKL